MIALIELDFANNQNIEQFLSLLVLMQQLNEDKKQSFALEQLNFGAPLMFGRRADNGMRFDPRPPILPPILEA